MFLHLTFIKLFAIFSLLWQTGKDLEILERFTTPEHLVVMLIVRKPKNVPEELEVVMGASVDGVPLGQHELSLVLFSGPEVVLDFGWSIVVSECVRSV